MSNEKKNSTSLIGNERGVNRKLSKLRIFLFLYGFARPHTPLLIAGTILYTSQSVMFSLISAVTMSGITGAILNLDYTMLLVTAIRILALLIFAIILIWVGILMYVSGELKTKRHLQTKMIQTFMKESIENHTHSGEKLSMLNNDAELANNLYSDAFAALLFCLMPIIGLSAAVFTIEWRMGIYTILAGLISMFGQLLFAKPLSKIAKGNLESVSAITKTFGDIFAGSLIARVFSLQDKLLGVFDHDNDNINNLINREARINGGQAIFMGISGLLTAGGIFIVGSMMIPGGDLTLPMLMAIVPMSSSAAMNISNIGNAWAGMQAPFEAGRRVYEMLNGDNSITPLVKHEVTAPIEHYDIDVKDLSFSFKEAETPLFNNVNLKVEQNCFAAFIGESGSGKSTLLKIIMGLYERDNFNITVGNKQYSKLYADEWFSYFAYVDQSCTLFDMTISENIALGRVDASPSDIKAAAIEANADEFIMSLPQGYDTVVGEAGASLSGGQRQRISIARALVRRAPILVFDEVTSALDADSEREIIETINRLRGKHTILMITHNLQAIDPDIIYVVESGKVIEFL